MNQLNGRRAIVTGGASGIGHASAQALKDAGADVVLADLPGDRLDEAAGAMGAEGWGVDLSKVDELADLTLEADILVNCAGIQKVAPIVEQTQEDVHRILMIMLEAPLLLIRATWMHMQQQQWGRIINISSAHGWRASEFKAPYVSAKHGLEGLSKVAANEGAPHGITSNCIAPGYVRTPLVEKQIADQAKTHGISEDEVLEKVIMARSPLKRLVEPAEIGDMVVFLCSDSAQSVTGASWTIDGGWTSR